MACSYLHGSLPRRSAPAITIAAWLGVAVWAVRGLVRRRSSGLEGKLLGLGAACLLALALCGAQLMPVIEFMAQSNRAGNLGANGRYVFSLSPSRLIGAFWPNVTGTVAMSQEWPLALPASFDETMQWVPSLYLGGLTLVLAVAGAGFREGPPWRPWLTAIVVVGTLAAMGEYSSPIYWARRAPALAAWLGPPDDRDMGDRNDGGRPGWRRQRLLGLHRGVPRLPVVPISGQAPRARLPGDRGAGRTGLGRSLGAASTTTAPWRRA